MDTEQEFYICPTCFQAWDSRPEWHEHEVFHYPGYPAGHWQLKPPVNGTRQLRGRAPRWFLMVKASTGAASGLGERHRTNAEVEGATMATTVGLTGSPVLKGGGEWAI